jgi:hypothetical protein
MKTIVCIFALLGHCVVLPAAEIGVSDLNPPARVTGSLGKPLGSRLVVEGVLAERVMLANPLLVSSVNAKPLKQPVAIEIQGKVQIQKGKQYRLEGYESGAFSGPPAWTVGDSVPQQPFQFHSTFVVTKVLETTAK